MAQAANHNDRPRSAVAFISALFGPTTEAPIFFQTYANDEGDPDEGTFKPPRLITRDVAPLEKFIAKWDRPRRGMFFCVGILERGASRSKENVRETIGLWADIDFKGVVENEPQIRAQILTLRCQPSVVVFSGHGLHLYWLFRETYETQTDLERIETALRRLADIVSGDTAVCEVARMMRLPGTHNTKSGDWRPVVAERLDGPRYELSDLEEWISEQLPILTRKPVEPKPGQAAEPADDNPFLAAAALLGHRPKLDVEAALAAMADGNIHNTQLSVSASLLKAGRELEEVVAILMDATRQAAGAAGLKWNWRAEEKRIRNACAGALKKFPPDNTAVSRETPDSQADIVDLGEAKAKRKPKPTATSRHIVLAEAVLAVIRQRGEGLMFTNKGDYRYAAGLWHLETDKSLQAWLNAALEEGARGLRMESANRLINEARAYILREPSLRRRDVPFDAHGCIPTASGLINPRTGVLQGPAPGHYCTWRVEPAYDPGATCPHWLQMLDDVFADRPDGVRAEYVQLLQEMLGAGLVDNKPKSLSKALILQGGSNYGKSGLLDVMSGLFGADVNTTPLEALEGAHGLMPFAYRVPWVLHEAFDQAKWHMSSVVKAIISGDGVQINIKNGPMLTRKVTVPILWGTNNPPQFKEATRAITNRIAVVECRRKFDEDAPVGAAAVARAAGYERPSDLVLATEMPGVLAWAVEGLRRAVARGHFLLPAEAKEAAEAIQLDSNIVAGFVADCVDFDKDCMVSTGDFAGGFVSWWFENKGEDRGAPSGDRIGKAVKALGDRRIAYDRELRDMGRRYYGGISLNAEGRRHWGNTVSSDAFVFQTRKSSASAPDANPNAVIPAGWDGKYSVQAMRAAQAKNMTSESGEKSSTGHNERLVMEKHDQHDQSKKLVMDGRSSTQVSERLKKPLF